MWKGSLLRVYTYFLPQGSEFAIFTLLNFSLASPSTHPLCYSTLSKHDTRRKEEVETQRSVFFHLHAFNNNERICTHHILLLLPFFFVSSSSFFTFSSLSLSSSSTSSSLSMLWCFLFLTLLLIFYFHACRWMLQMYQTKDLSFNWRMELFKAML